MLRDAYIHSNIFVARVPHFSAFIVDLWYFVSTKYNLTTEDKCFSVQIIISKVISSKRMLLMLYPKFCGVLDQNGGQF